MMVGCGSGMKRRFEAMVVEDDLCVKQRRREGSGLGSLGASADSGSSGGGVSSDTSEEIRGVSGGGGGGNRGGGLGGGSGGVVEGGSSTRSCDSSSSSSCISAGENSGTTSAEKLLSRNVRRKLAKAGANPTLPVFTADDVKEIALHSMKERESKLREEYCAILNDRLAEQFQAFSNFNHDSLFSVYREPAKTYVS